MLMKGHWSRLLFALVVVIGLTAVLEQQVYEHYSKTRWLF